MTVAAPQVFRWRRSPGILLVGLAAHGGALVAIRLSQTPYEVLLLSALALSGLLAMRAWRASAGAIVRDAAGQWNWAGDHRREEHAVPVRIVGVLRWPLLLIVDLLAERPDGKAERRVLAIAADAIARDDLRRLSGLLRRVAARSGGPG